MQHRILLLYTAHAAGEHTPFSDTKYQRCYEALYVLGEKAGIRFCRAPLAWFDSSTNVFLKTWEYLNGEWKLSGPVRPDLIFDKTSGHSESNPIRKKIISQYPFVDDPAFTRFANNKYKTSRLLPQYFKPYKKIKNATSLARFLKTYSAEKLVLKPEIGSGGKGVYILTKQEALQLKPSFPVIVQEFIDSSRGIPGITNSYHDLRLVFFGDEFVYSYIRTPKKGRLLANIAQGGKMKLVPKNKLPSSLKPIISATKKLFAPFPQKTYTIDVMFDEYTRPWIVEFNTMPGLFFPSSEKATMTRVYQRLISELKKSLPTEHLNNKQQKSIGVVLFSHQKILKKKPFSKDIFQTAYTEFFKLADNLGLKLYRAAADWYDRKEKRFHTAWEWDGKKWVIASNIIPDVIYDKTISDENSLPLKKLLEKQFPILNIPAFSLHAGSKFRVSHAFRKFSKPYTFVKNRTELIHHLYRFPEKFIVAKPERGNSGEGIFIGEKERLLQQPLSFPLLIQEFVDSSAGIPGVVEGLHDLRLIYSGDTFIYAYYRTPKRGSFLANVAQGGRQTMVPKSKLPTSVWPIVRAVQRYYKKYPEKIYTIDLMFDLSGRPWLVELNTMPGLYPDASERPHIKKLYHAIILALKKAASKNNVNTKAHHHG